MASRNALGLVTGPSSAMNLAIAVAHVDIAPPSTIALVTKEPGGAHSAMTKRVVETLSPHSDFVELVWRGAQTSGLPGRALDTLWLCRPHAGPEKRLAETHREARIVLFDEGIGSLVDRGSAAAGGGAGRNDQPPSPFAGDMADRVLFWFSSVTTFGGPAFTSGMPTRAPDRAAVIQIVARLKDGLGVGDRRFGRPASLVLGTAFHLNKRYRRADEQALYQGVLDRERRRGDLVVWVEHPRARGFFEGPAHGEWLDGASGIVASPLETGVPIEILALDNEIARTVSLGSSAQVTFAEWFGVPSEVVTAEPFEQLGEWKPHVARLRTLYPAYPW